MELRDYIKAHKELFSESYTSVWIYGDEVLYNMCREHPGHDNPEIAVACFIPNGYSGSEASKAPKEFIDWYMNQKNLRMVEDSLPIGNSLAP